MSVDLNREVGPSSPAPKLTPLMQQYWDVKAAHEDKVLLFRMGDFFEMFHRDAETAAPVLGIALTSRNKNAADQIPMCGVPHHPGYHTLPCRLNTHYLHSIPYLYLAAFHPTGTHRPSSSYAEHVFHAHQKRLVHFPLRHLYIFIQRLY